MTQARLPSEKLVLPLWFDVSHEGEEDLNPGGLPLSVAVICATLAIEKINGLDIWLV